MSTFLRVLHGRAVRLAFCLAMAVAMAPSLRVDARERARAKTPVVEFQALFAGNALIQPQAIAADRHGNSYVVGFTGATDFPTTPGAFQHWDPPGEDAFVAKLDRGGRIVYATYLGGAGSEAALGVAVDDHGRAFVAGTTTSADFPIKNPVQPAYGGAGDGFVAMINADGSNIIYSTYLGGSAADSAADLVVDGWGRAYVGGATTSLDFPIRPGSRPMAGTQDGFVVILAARGTRIEASQLFGGSGRDAVTDIAVVHRRRLYVTGVTESADFPVANAIQTALAGGQDAFVSMLDASLVPLFSTFLGGANNESSPSIAVDRHGGVYVAGRTGAAGFPLRRPLQPVPGTMGDFFVTKIDAERARLVYSTYLGGSDAEDEIHIAVDDIGRAYLSGSSESPDFPGATPMAGPTSGVFLAVVSRAGNRLVHSTWLPVVPGDEHLFHAGSGVAVGSDHTAYVTGWGSAGFVTAVRFSNRASPR